MQRSILMAMRGIVVGAAGGVFLTLAVAQDVLIESGTEGGEILRVEREGASSYYKKGIVVSNVHDGITVDIYQPGSTYESAGIESFVTNYNATILRSMRAEAVAGGGSTVTGLDAHASGGFGSFGIGVSGTVAGGGSSVNYGVYGAASGGSGSMNAAGYFNGAVHLITLHAISDQKFKKNVRDIEDGISLIKALRPRLYEMRVEEFKESLNFNHGIQMGFVAQEIGEVIPELVSNSKAPVLPTRDGQDKNAVKAPIEYQSVNYSGLIPVLVKAMQEQQVLIEALQAELAAMR